MTYNPETAAILRERLSIGQLLDDSAELSFLQRATLRMEMLGILDGFEQHRDTAGYVLGELSHLHSHVIDVTTPALPLP